MSVAGKPHQNEIEQRMRRIESIAPIEALELRLVVACRHGWAICIRGDRVNVAGRNGHAIEEEASRHAHIAVGVVPWHEAVVAHEPVHPTPGQFAAIRLARQTLVKSFGTRAAGQADRGPLRDGCNAG